MKYSALTAKDLVKSIKRADSAKNEQTKELARTFAHAKIVA